MNKTKQNKMSEPITSIFAKSLMNKSVSLPIHHLNTANLKDMLEKLLATDIEGKCIEEGYVKPSSVKIVSYSSGLIEKGNLVTFETVFECDICYPVEGSLISCVAKNITKAGIRAESAELVPSPVVVFIAREYHNNSILSAVKENDKITVRVIGQRIELNDKFVSVIGELVSNKKITSLSK